MGDNVISEWDWCIVVYIEELFIGNFVFSRGSIWFVRKVKG